MKKNEWQLVSFTLLIQLGVGTFTLWGIAAILLQGFYSFNDYIFVQYFPLFCLVIVISGAFIAS